MSTFAAAGQPQPFKISVEQAVLDDLRVRLGRVRWPDEAPGPAWSYGTSVEYMRELVDYWRTSFDWRVAEATLNVLPQFRVALDGIDLHYIRVEGKGPRPLPLLLSHGWPGSIFEFIELIPRLTDPASFGGDARDAFTVIAPSLPGYGLSFAPGQPRFGAPEMAQTLHRLMTEVLGYKQYVAQGGDWGAFVTSRLAADHPEALRGIHINLLAVRREPQPESTLTEEERRFNLDLKHWLKEEMGYQWIMGTRPQTLAFGLTDSPVGLAAWIVEKFRAWSDCDGLPERAIERDRMLANITLYWVTGAINSSSWPYYARMHGPWPIGDGGRITVPTAYAAFPKEILRPPRSVAERYYNIQRWTEMPRGGHFAALEQPDLLAADVREFFRAMRD